MKKKKYFEQPTIKVIELQMLRNLLISSTTSNRMNYGGDHDEEEW
jgi:hypothetical protein